MKILIAYFSHKGMNWTPDGLAELAVGNTAVAAAKIAALTGGELFEIRAAVDYPFAYDACVARSRDELRADARPAPAESKDVAPYDVVILGFPNWCGTMPMPVWTFLESGDFAGKTILPFCTNEGSGMGKSERDLQKLCPQARLSPGLALRGGKVHTADADIAAWLKKNKIIYGG